MTAGVLERLRTGLGDRYEVEREIGQGGMATVFRAVDKKHGRPVAIKVFRPELARSIGAERFLREIEVSAKLQHPHIIPLYDSGETDGLLYYVMPFVEGESLRDRLVRDGRVPYDEAVALTREVASALSYAHGNGIVHRDIKPENIMLSGGHAVVADFGIARAFDVAKGDPNLTGIGFVVGTPAYMSPEQATASEVDGRSDQYSLACVFYEMVSGAQPFSGPTVQAVLTQALTGPRPKLTKSSRGTPPKTDSVVGKALAGDPAQRYDLVTTFSDALLTASEGGTVNVKRTRRLLALVGFFAAAWAGSLALRFFQSRAAAGPVRAEAASIAVLPFTVSGAGVELLGEGMVDLLTTNLNAVGGIRAVEPRLVLSRWRKDPADDVASAVALAHSVDANAVVMGSIVGAGSRVRISAVLHGPDGAELATAQVDGAQDSILALVDDLSANLVRAIWRSDEPVPSLQVSGITTNSLAAMRNFLAGERYYRRSAWDSAQAAYRRAVEQDSTFSLAWSRLAASIGWTGAYGQREAVEASAAAVRFSSRLPPRERALVVGADLFNRRRDQAAADSMERYVRQYPTDVEGWFLLGEVYYHGRPANGLGRDTIAAAFDRVLALDSSLAPAAIHPAELALLDRDSAGVARYVRVMELAGSRDLAAAFRAANRVALGGPIDSATVAAMEVQAGASMMSLLGALGSPRLTSDSVLALLDDAMGPAGLGIGASQGALVRSMVRAGLGRFTDAYRLADSLRQSNRGVGSSAVLQPALIGIAPPAYAAADLEQFRSAPLRNPYQAYYASVLALHRGDLARAARISDSLVAADSSGVPRRARALATAVGGWVLVVRGDTAAGLRQLRAGIGQTGAGDNFLSAPVRLAYAATLAARPNTRAEGIRWLENAFRLDPAVLAYRHLLLGRAYEAAGDKPAAVRSYSLFLRLWDEASPGTEPVTDDARLAVRRLTSEAQELK